MDTNLKASIRVLNGKRARIPLLGSCVLLATFLFAACSSSSPATKNDGGRDAADSSSGSTDSVVKDVIALDSAKADVPMDAPAGCSVGGVTYATGQSVVVAGNCPTTCVCLAGGTLGNCYSDCPNDGGTPPVDVGPVCSWGGKTYSPGESLPLNDGCGGSCVCQADGTAGHCTGQCPVDGGAIDAPVDLPPPVDTGCAAGDSCTLTGGGRGLCSAAGACGACSGAQADTRCTTAYGAGYVCVSGQCTSGCNNSGQCTGGRLCDTATHACVACNVSTIDAGDPQAAADNRCKSDTTYGQSSICLAGACTTGDCHDSTDCNTGRICGASVPHACGDCSTDQQCTQDPQYGSGHICVSNLCVQGNCHATSDCTTAGQVCNPSTHTCGACASDTQCATEYTNRPICVTTTGLGSTGLCVANNGLCTANNVTCPRNGNDFCCGNACVAGNCCVTADCAAIDPVYVCQGHTCTHCDAVSGNSYFVDPTNGDDARANGSGRAGGAAAADCAFKTLSHALDVLGAPTAATTITIVGPSTFGAAAALNGEATLPFVVPARVTITTQGGAVTLALRTGEEGFRFVGGTGTAGSALSPATGSALTIDRASASAVPAYGIRVEPTGTGTVTLSNVTINHAGGGAANGAVEIVGGTVAMSNVTVGTAGANGIVVTAGTVTLNAGVQVTGAGQDGLAVSGGTVTISNATATNTATLFNDNARYGIRVSGATSVLNLTGGISGTTRSVVTQNNGDSNVDFASTSANASSINGLYSFGSQAADGLRIVAGSQIVVRNSTFLGNDLSGIHIVTSNTGATDDLTGIDLGTGTAATGDVRGRNTLQTASPTASRNGGAGLCVGVLTAGAGAQTLSAQANLFAGATTGTRDCVTNNPGDLAVSTTCTGNTDLGVLTQPGGVSVTVETDNCTQP